MRDGSSKKSKVCVWEETGLNELLIRTSLILFQLTLHFVSDEAFMDQDTGQEMVQHQKQS